MPTFSAKIKNMKTTKKILIWATAVIIVFAVGSRIYKSVSNAVSEDSKVY